MFIVSFRSLASYAFCSPFFSFVYHVWDVNRRGYRVLDPGLERMAGKDKDMERKERKDRFLIVYNCYGLNSLAPNIHQQETGFGLLDSNVGYGRWCLCSLPHGDLLDRRPTHLPFVSLAAIGFKALLGSNATGLIDGLLPTRLLTRPPTWPTTFSRHGRGFVLRDQPQKPEVSVFPPISPC